MMWLCRRAVPAVCVRVCVHEGVRLIEVVRVKMIPSGGGGGEDVTGGGGRSVGSAVGDGESEG